MEWPPIRRTLLSWTTAVVCGNGHGRSDWCEEQGDAIKLHVGDSGSVILSLYMESLAKSGIFFCKTEKREDWCRSSGWCSSTLTSGPHTIVMCQCV